MNIFRNVVDFWVLTWKEDRRLFWIETIGTFLGMCAALILNIQSTAPNMLFILSLYLVSAKLLVISSYIRKSSFMVLLMAFYALTSVYGLINLYL